MRPQDIPELIRSRKEVTAAAAAQHAAQEAVKAVMRRDAEAAAETNASSQAKRFRRAWVIAISYLEEPLQPNRNEEMRGKTPPRTVIVSGADGEEIAYSLSFTLAGLEEPGPFSIDSTWSRHGTDLGYDDVSYYHETTHVPIKGLQQSPEAEAHDLQALANIETSLAAYVAAGPQATEL